MSSETKQHILKRAVLQCPSITMEFLGLKVPSLLDSGSMVMLIHEAYFNKHILPLLHATAEELAEPHSLFWLSATNNQDMPVSKYFEADVTNLGFCILSVGFSVVRDPNTVLEPQHSTQSPGVVRCNLIWLGCEEFEKVFRFEAFDKSECLDEVHPLVFSQMCTLYHQGKAQAQSVSFTSNSLQSNSISGSSIPITTSEINVEIKGKDLSLGSETVLGQVWVGSPYKAICIVEVEHCPWIFIPPCPMMAIRSRFPSVLC